MFEIQGKYTTARVMIDTIDASCAAQIHQFVNHPSFSNPVAVMPDTHAGKGSVIGFTMPLASTVIPNIIGVDIGCGMTAINMGSSFTEPLEKIDRKIRQHIPFGMAVHDTSQLNMEREFPWHDADVLARKFATAYREQFGISIVPPKYAIDWFLKKSEAIRSGGHRRFINSVGTLGGGNHFIEIGIDEARNFWLTIHTGSRNFGKCICEYWQGKAAKSMSKGSKEDTRLLIEEAKEEISDEKELYRTIKEIRARGGNRPGIDLKGCEWLEGHEASGYLFDMVFAQIYAEVNRRHIARIICSLCDITPRESIETVHNYIDFRDFIIRKGAIRSYTGEKMVIPFNMRDGILLCEGKSNSEWNFSAPHGAGRVMSRHEARRTLDPALFRQQMAGIYSTSVGRGTIDEAPDAYKPAELIERAITPTASIINRIKPIHNMKDKEGHDD